MLVVSRHMLCRSIRFKSATGAQQKPFEQKSRILLSSITLFFSTTKAVMLVCITLYLQTHMGKAVSCTCDEGDAHDPTCWSSGVCMCVYVCVC